MRSMLIAGLLASTCAFAADGEIPVIKIEKSASPTEFIFMAVHVVDHGKTANEKFFLGPLPQIGDAVEMVYVGDEADGSMKFQLRVKR